MLIVFVDALPYSKKIRIKSLDESALIPNLGYSVNLHNEIFNGKNPDEIGFFGEYVYSKPKNKITVTLFRILNIFEYLPFNVNNLFKIFLRKFLKIKIGQIPFKMVPYFKREGKYPFIGECRSILDNFKKFVTDDLKNGLGNRDSVIINEVLSYMEKETFNENIFVSLCDLDGIGHKYGVDSDEYFNRLNFLEKQINMIVVKYQKNFNNSPILVLSDHGMSNVKKFIDPRKTINHIEKKFKLHCFYDSLYLHVFFRDKNLLFKKNIVEKIIKKNLPVSIFDERDRLVYGITNRNFGDIICLLKNEHAFSPNLFGFLKLKAYHGYMPGSLDNKGVFLSKNLKSKCKKNIKSIDVYDIIVDNMKKIKI